jgi:uncharacterized membrane protein YgcG
MGSDPVAAAPAPASSLLSAAPAAKTCGFVVICPPKAISFDKSDHEFHRDLHAAELKRELEWEVADGDGGATMSSTYAVLPGGGARVLNASATTSLFVLEGKTDGQNEPEAAADGALPAEQEAAHGLFAVFKGILTNRAALAQSLGLSCGDDATTATPSNAALVVRMYQKHGIHLLGRLEGSWSFCLFDAHQGRVLAARAPCGGVPLFEGRTAGGALAITCGAFLPPGCKDVHAIAPGCAKWGWSSAPRPYSPGVAQQREGRRPAGDRTILRRSIELGQHNQQQQNGGGNGRGSSGGGGGGAGGNGSGGGGGAPHASADNHQASRRWSDASGASSAMGPDEVAAAAAPAIPRHPLHADAPAYFPPRRSSETGAGAGANGASWRAAAGPGGGGGGGGSQRSSRRSSYEHPPSGRASQDWGHPHSGSGGGGSARPSGDRRRSGTGGGAGGGGSARPSCESKPPLSGAAAARRASADGQAPQGQAAAAGAAAAAMSALHV